MASLFGITAAEIQAKLAPAGSDYSFSIGDAEGDDMSTAACLDVIETMEDRVLGIIPDKYRALMRRVDGEVLIESATEGQTSAVLGLFPVSAGTLNLYVNFGSVRSWFERRAEDRLDADLFSLNATTGEVTFSPGLHRGDVVFADYDHAAATKFRWLKECAKAYAAVEIARRFAYFATASGFERFEQWEAGTNIALRDLARSENPGVDGIEKIKLVRETKTVRLSQLLGDPMNLEIPMKEVAVGAGALVTIAQAQVGPVDVVTLQGLVQGLGVPGVVIGVLIWIIREERARNDAREKAFLASLETLSGSVEKSGGLDGERAGETDDDGGRAGPEDERGAGAHADEARRT